MIEAAVFRCFKLFSDDFCNKFYYKMIRIDYKMIK